MAVVGSGIECLADGMVAIRREDGAFERDCQVLGFCNCRGVEAMPGIVAGWESGR